MTTDLMQSMSQASRFLLAGVMGWPVMHSRSPMLHGHWLEGHQLKGAYLPLAIAPDGLEAALRALKALGFSGVNLTIPHKQAAMTIMDELDDASMRIGAISCVTVREGGTLAGSNNDWVGFIRNLKEAAPTWQAKSGPAVVLGARLRCFLSWQPLKWGRSLKQGRRANSALNSGWPP